MSKNRIKAFTMTELLVSTALAGLVLAGAMTIYGNLQRKEIEASLQSEFRSLSKLIEEGILSDLQNAVRFSDVDGEMLGVSTGGSVSKLLVSDADASDVFGMMIVDPQYSVAESFELSSVNSKTSTISVLGDFRPLKKLTEDYFILKRGEDVELLLRDGAITYSHGQSSFKYDSDHSSPLNFEIIDSLNPVRVFRVVLTYYRIGNGSLTSGLYRSQGQNWESIKDTSSAWQQISNRVDSMQVRYWFSDINGPAEADCLESTISGSRKPLLAGTSCQWSNLTSMRVEFSLISDQEIFSVTGHPHKKIKNKTLKHLHLISSAPKAESLD